MRALALLLIALIVAAPGFALAGPKVLLVTRTAGPRHANLGPPLAPGLDPPLAAANRVQRGMLALAARRGWTLHYAEDPKVIADMDGYDVVVLFSTSRDFLDARGRAALRRLLKEGGGVVAVHNALGAMYDWPFYEAMLGGTYFRRHGPHRDGQVIVLDAADPSMRDVPARFAFKDEWYQLARAPRGVELLAADGEGRPVAWRHCHGGGKVWVTTLGHDDDLFAGVRGEAAFEAMIAGAVEAVGAEAPAC